MNKKKKLVILAVVLLTLVIGISYATYNFVIMGQKEHKISTAKVSFAYKEPSIALDLTSYNGISDALGMAQTNYYEFQVNGESTKADTINYFIYLLKIGTNTLNDSDVKLYLTSVNDNIETQVVAPTLISDLYNQIGINNSKGVYQNSFTFDGINTEKQTHTYRLRIWLKEEFDLNSYISETSSEIDGETIKNYDLDEMSYQFKLNVSTGILNQSLDPSGANAPELATGMIPVYYDETDDLWKKADALNENMNYQWYSYESSGEKKGMWANAVTVDVSNPTTKNTYFNNDMSIKIANGTPISMDDINTMWVWIPRFNATLQTCSMINNPTIETYPDCYDYVTIAQVDKENLISFCVNDYGLEQSECTTAVNEIIATGYEHEYIDWNLQNFILSYQDYHDEYELPNLISEKEFISTKNFESSINITFTDNSSPALDAFWWDEDNDGIQDVGEQKSGFWYGKFETSHSTLIESGVDDNLECINETCSNANGIIIKPDVVSLRINNISNFFYASRSMEQANNSFGFVSSEVDTHMSKNNEWGAVAYLTQSIYGRCTSSLNCPEVYINNSSWVYTGRSGGNVGGQTPINGTYTSQTSTRTYNIPGFYTYNGYLLSYDTNNIDITTPRDFSKIASTTGTIYGVYDMVGGSNEYVMGNYDHLSGSTESSNSGFTGLLEDGTTYIGTPFPNSKYVNIYTDYNIKMHALNETSGWHEDYVYLSHLYWIIRSGGYYSWNNDSGMFFADNGYVNANINIGSRFSIIK